MKKKIEGGDSLDNNSTSDNKTVSNLPDKIPKIVLEAYNDPIRQKHNLAVVFVTKHKHPNFKNWNKLAQPDQTIEELYNLYKKTGGKVTGYSFVAGVDGLVGIDFDWVCVFPEFLEKFKDKKDTVIITTGNKGKNLLYITNKPISNLQFKNEYPRVEIHGDAGRQMIVSGTVLNEQGKLSEYSREGTEILRWDTVVEDVFEFLEEKAREFSFMHYKCIKESLSKKKNKITYKQSTALGMFCCAEKIPIERAVNLWRMADDFEHGTTLKQLKYIYDKHFNHPKCDTLKNYFDWKEENCSGCIRKQCKEPDESSDTGEKEQPKGPIPDFDEFLQRNSNPAEKLRHGQGYDPELGLTYMGTFPGTPFGHYGISRKKPIRATHETHEIANQVAHPIRILGGFTDPLTDKTLGQLKILLEELHRNGKIENKPLSVLAKNTLERSSHYIDFSHPLDRVLFVFWIIGTYLRALFTWYPYLAFEGLRDVGKSTALEFQSHTCFNGGGDVSGGHTEADLHKAAASTMGFFAIDHLEEKLKSHDKRQVLNEFLENAWKLNSYVSKRDQSTGEQLRLYLASSIALGTRRTTETIAEKGLIIRMHETNNNELRQRSVTMYKDDFFKDIEKDLMAMALHYQNKIKKSYETIPVIHGLGREYNKFLPFLAIAKVIDDETKNENDYFNQLREYALEYRKNRKEEQEDTEEILLRLILKVKDEIEKSTYKDLAALMKKEGYDNYSWQTAKADIRKLGIVKRYNRNKSPITLELDMKRAEERAKTRGIILKDNNESKTHSKDDETIQRNEKSKIDYENSEDPLTTKDDYTSMDDETLYNLAYNMGDETANDELAKRMIKAQTKEGEGDA